MNKIKKIICYFRGHYFHSHTKHNNIITTRCARCFQKRNALPGDYPYYVECILSKGKMILPLIKENVHTVIVGISDKIIKLHKIKHQVIIH
ncbi:hypothetical protein LCGC14_2522490 [marine sediment metagenome]|uniref:Uncharacterized protein n=1 Tax=marine sediment metagenome TaxID=412755 RepID=A0A0F9AWG5_9ZZZZ